MGEQGGASGDAGLACVVRGVLEQHGVPGAVAIAEAVMLHGDHPRWAVLRPAGPRPPGPEVAMLWVRAGTAAELSVRMRQADAGLSPG